MNKKLEKKLSEKANPEKAKLLQRFFKTGKGEYGEGDVFLGIVVPEQRLIAKEFSHLKLEEIQELLDSKVHEKRMIGLFILIRQFERAFLEETSERTGDEKIGACKEKDEKTKKKIFEFYLKNAGKSNINNWDLVDLSAPNIVGKYLLDNIENCDNSQALALRGKASSDKDILYELVKSDNLWERRIAIISCFAFIRQNEFEDALKISRILLGDSHNLIHKAVGWMLREIGKRDVSVLEEFLKNHCREMPRTMLRYAIEKFPEEKRKKYLKGEI